MKQLTERYLLKIRDTYSVPDQDFHSTKFIRAYSLRGKKLSAISLEENSSGYQVTCMVWKEGLVEVRRAWPFLIVDKWTIRGGKYCSQTVAIFGARGWDRQPPAVLKKSLPRLMKDMPEMPKAGFKPCWDIRHGSAINLLGEVLERSPRLRKILDRTFVVVANCPVRGMHVHVHHFYKPLEAQKFSGRVVKALASGQQLNLNQSWIPYDQLLTLAQRDQEIVKASKGLK